MDGTLHHDPYAPDTEVTGAASPTAFRESRFAAVGASEEEIANYRAAHEELSPEDQANNNLIIDEADDEQMAAWLAEDRAEADTDQGDDGDEEDGEGEPVVEPPAAPSAPATPAPGNKTGTGRKGSAKAK